MGCAMSATKVGHVGQQCVAIPESTAVRVLDRRAVPALTNRQRWGIVDPAEDRGKGYPRSTPSLDMVCAASSGKDHAYQHVPQGLLQ